MTIHIKQLAAHVQIVHGEYISIKLYITVFHSLICVHASMPITHTHRQIERERINVCVCVLNKVEYARVLNCMVSACLECYQSIYHICLSE